MDFYTNVFARGDKVYVRGYKNGERVAEKIPYSPYLFELAPKNAQTEFRLLDGTPLIKMPFNTIKEAKDHLKIFDNVSGKPIYGLENFAYLYIYDNFHGDIHYDVGKINIISIDIETDSSGGFPNIETADKEITAITVSRRGEKVVLGLKPYKSKSDKVTYLRCKDEHDLLTKFLRVWQSGRFMPDVITGWNIEFFDIPYLVNRIKRILGNKEANLLSPWGILNERKLEIHGKEMTVYVPAGINVLDYYALYKKFSFGNEESYKLDHIAEKVLGQKKLDFKSEGYVSLDDMYQRNFEMFIDYNIHDVTLIDLLEEKLKFIEQVIAFAYDAKVNYADTFTTVRPWDIIIHNYLMDRCIVVPRMKINTFDQELIGGYVKEPRLGLSKWVVSFDLNSLYPHLFMHYNISPETYIGSAKEDGWPSLDELLEGNLGNLQDEYAYAANGTMYRKNKQGFLPALMEKMYNDRVEYKQKMIECKKKLIEIDKEIKRRGITL